MQGRERETGPRRSPGRGECVKGAAGLGPSHPDKGACVPGSALLGGPRPKFSQAVGLLKT